ncbi:MAG: DsbA family protein [Alphaproteobacteria bacterium]|nr:DsbA family protein [Alphaproteobacteria bacterium]
MRNVCKVLFLALLLSASSPVWAKETVLPDHAEGKATAPITMVEYSSFTCSHCADFYNDVMPQIEKNYIETGKVRVIHRDFPNDAYSLKAAALTRCMPEGQYFPFVHLLFKNFRAWIMTPKPEETLKQYAQMAGLPQEKVKSCLDDTDLLDAIVAMRNEGAKKYEVTGTPTFILNDGQDVIVGTRPYEEMAAAFDKILADKKK